MTTELPLCDGCGQAAAPEHLRRRLQRLEWATRFRPIHIQIVFLSRVSSERDEEFLYAETEKEFAGEALALLNAVGIAGKGRPREAVLTEFQRRGCFLAHVLECPTEGASQEELERLVAARLPRVVTRLKRSLKPKRVTVISRLLRPHLAWLKETGLEAEIAMQEEFPAATGLDQAVRANEKFHPSR